MNTSEKLCPFSDLDFCDWMLSAPPGSTTEYYRGSLAVDADPGLSSLAEDQRLELCEVRRRAFNAASNGSVHLVQRRIGSDCFSYLAITSLRRRDRTEGSAALDAIVFKERRSRPETHSSILESRE